MTDILMPALSPTMEEGTLAKWLVKAGDTIRSGDVIAEIETDKATMEVEAVDEGVIEALLVPEGTEGVKVNAPIARIAGGEGASAPPPAKPASPPTTAPTPAREPATPPQPAPAASAPRPFSGGRIAASPLARRVAAQRGLDLAAIRGSGPHGRIILRDVENAQPGPAARAAPSPFVASEPAQVKSLEQLGIPPGSYDLKPLDGMRRTVARRLTDSFRDIPHFPLNVDIEIDALLAARAAVNALLADDGVKVSVNDMVIKAAAVALKRAPDANASFTPDGIAYHHHADIAVAVAVEGGLITPIIRSAETKGFAQIATEMKDLAARARARKLKPEEFHGGTFTISNLGMFGVKSFGSIINAPHGAILSVGAGEQRPIVKAGALGIATVMSVTMTCDHRVVDGAIGARWLAIFKTLVENPAAISV